MQEQGSGPRPWHSAPPLQAWVPGWWRPRPVGAAALFGTEITPSKGWPDRLRLAPSGSGRAFALFRERTCATGWVWGLGSEEGTQAWGLRREGGRGRRKNEGMGRAGVTGTTVSVLYNVNHPHGKYTVAR